MVCEDFSRYLDSVSCTSNSLKKKSNLGKLTEQKNESSLNREARFKLYKADFCLFYRNGACNRGERCTFAHHNSELRDRPDLLKTRMCKDYLQNGSCKIDQLCNFAHGEKELKTVDENVKEIAVQQNILHTKNSAFKKVGERLTNSLFEKVSKSKINKRNIKEEKSKALSCTMKPFLEEKEMNNSARCKFLANKTINNKVSKIKCNLGDINNDVKRILVEKNNNNREIKDHHGSTKIDSDSQNFNLWANSNISMINSFNYETESNQIKKVENKEENENENKRKSEGIEKKIYLDELGLSKYAFFERNNNCKNFSYNDLFSKQKKHKKEKNALLSSMSNTIIKEAYDINNFKKNSVGDAMYYSLFSNNGNYTQDKEKLCSLEEEAADLYDKVSNNNDFFVEQSNFSGSSYGADLSTLVLTCESSSSPSSSTPLSFCGSTSNNNCYNKIEESEEETELRERNNIHTEFKEEKPLINRFNDSFIVERSCDINNKISCFLEENKKKGKSIMREKSNSYVTNTTISNTTAKVNEMCIKEEKVFNAHSNKNEFLFDINNIESKYDDNLFHTNFIKTQCTSAYENNDSAIRKDESYLTDSERNKIMLDPIFENKRPYNRKYDIFSDDSHAQRKKYRTEKEDKQAKETNIQKATSLLSDNCENVNNDNNNETSNSKISITLDYNDHYFFFVTLPSNFLFCLNQNQANNSIIYNHHMIHPQNSTNEEYNYIKSEQTVDDFLLYSPYIYLNSRHENIIQNPFYIPPITNSFLYANQSYVSNNPNNHINSMQNNIIFSILDSHIPKNCKIKEPRYYSSKLIKDKFFCENEKQNNKHLRKCLYFLSFHYKLFAFHTSFDSSLLETKYLQDAMPVMYEE